MGALKSTIIAAALSALCFLPSSGQETMVLRDGSRLYGRTWKENFNDFSKTFSFDSVSMVVPKSAILNLEPYKVPVSSLGSKMKEYFARHKDKYIYHNNEPYVYVANGFSYTRGNKVELNFSDYVVIEEVTDSTARIFWPNIGMMQLDWNKEIDHIETSLRDGLALVGTIDEIETSRGERLVGQIVNTDHTGTTILTDDGVRHNVLRGNIRAKRVRPYNPNRPLKEQMKNIHQLYGKSGLLQNGFIVETVYASGKEDGYYMVTDTEGLNKTKYRFADVDIIARSVNNDFVKELDVNVSGDDFLINGVKATPMKYVEKADRYEMPDTTGVLHLKASQLKDGKLKVHFRNLPLSTEFYFVEALPDLQPQKDANKDKAKAKKKDKDAPDTPDAVPFYTTLHAMLRSLSPTDRFMSPIGNVSMNFGPVAQGKAYFIIPKADPDKMAYMVLIEP